MAVPTATLATSAASRVARTGARRPTAAARTSSSRPVSSSVRVCRMTTAIDIRPAAMAPNALDCQATCPPTVSRARAGPAMAIIAVFSPMLAAATSSSAWLAYRPSMPTAWDQ